MLTHDAALARWCLESIANHGAGGRPDRVETVLVLNDSTAAVRDLVGHTSGARVVDCDVNVGTTMGWNLGFAAARAPKLLLMHEDAAVAEGMTDSLAAVLDADTKAGVVAPWTAPGIGDPPHNVGWLLARDGRQLHIEPAMLPAEFRDAPYAVDVVSSAISMWQRDAWRQIGGFDERRYPAVGSDIDACTALWAHGRSVVVDPTTAGAHRTGAMDGAPGPLTGPRLRDFLYEGYLDHWRSKWSEFAASRLPGGETALIEPATLSVDDRDPRAAFADGLRHAALRATRLSQSPHARRAQRPLSAAKGTDVFPAELDAPMRERVAAAERGVIDRYCRWLAHEHEAALKRGDLLAERAAELEAALGTAHAELGDLREQIQALQPRSDALQQIYEGGWWRLRSRLRRLTLRRD